ncbi:hypothetical protein GC173_00790 [bacterium]|nr:hypothetical protein [bacterium]
MHSFVRAMCLLIAVATFAGCSTSRTTTTPRTAIEQALVSQSAEWALEKFEDPNMSGKTFTFDDSQFDAVDKAFSLSALRLQLLKFGLKEAKADEAELIARPRSAVSSIDDSSFLIGIPELPIIIPGAGSVSIPEIALLGYNKQIGMNRMGMYAAERESGSLAHDFGISASRAHYVRWRVLFFISFRHTNLEEPYRRAAKTGVNVE